MDTTKCIDNHRNDVSDFSHDDIRYIPRENTPPTLQSPGDRLRSRAPQAKILRFEDPFSAISKAKTVIFGFTFGSHSLPATRKYPLPNPLKGEGGYFPVEYI